MELKQKIECPYKEKFNVELSDINIRPVISEAKRDTSKKISEICPELIKDWNSVPEQYQKKIMRNTLASLYFDAYIVKTLPDFLMDENILSSFKENINKDLELKSFKLLGKNIIEFFALKTYINQNSVFSVDTFTKDFFDERRFTEFKNLVHLPGGVESFIRRGFLTQISVVFGLLLSIPELSNSSLENMNLSDIFYKNWIRISGQFAQMNLNTFVYFSTFLKDDSTVDLFLFSEKLFTLDENFFIRIKNDENVNIIFDTLNSPYRFEKKQIEFLRETLNNDVNFYTTKCPVITSNTLPQFLEPLKPYIDYVISLY